MNRRPHRTFNPWKVLIPSMIGLLVVFGVIYAFTRNSQPGTLATPSASPLVADPNSQPIEAASPPTGAGETGIPAGGEIIIQTTILPLAFSNRATVEAPSVNLNTNQSETETKTPPVPSPTNSGNRDARTVSSGQRARAEASLAAACSVTARRALTSSDGVSNQLNQLVILVD